LAPDDPVVRLSLAELLGPVAEIARPPDPGARRVVVTPAWTSGGTARGRAGRVAARPVGPPRRRAERAEPGRAVVRSGQATAREAR
jgi:hypothetical protein